MQITRINIISSVGNGFCALRFSFNQSKPSGHQYDTSRCWSAETNSVTQRLFKLHYYGWSVLWFFFVVVRYLGALASSSEPEIPFFTFCFLTYSEIILNHDFLQMETFFVVQWSMDVIVCVLFAYFDKCFPVFLNSKFFIPPQYFAVNC